MALSKKAQVRIQKALDRFKAYMKFKAIGPHALTPSELKDLIRNGMIRPNEPIRPTVVETYLATHQQVAQGDVATKSVRDGALDFLERQFERYTGKFADQLKVDVLSTLENNIMPFVDRREGQTVYQVLKDPSTHAKNLRAELQGKIENAEFRWKTIVNTELNRASNMGSMDAILHNNAEKGPEEIHVYKRGNKPGHGACEHCARFWYLEDGITPRVYKMSELMANGSNIGKKRRDWLPTIDATHPNESHILMELRPGNGFVNGELEYIGRDHDEYKRQRGL